MVLRLAGWLARLAALGLLGGAVALTTQSPAAAACTCQDKTIEEHEAAADAVFNGSVRETRNSNSGGRRTVTYVVEVDRVWKEDGTVVTQTVKVSSARSANACGLGDLPDGTAYVFFAKARDTGFRASSCGGSRPATDAFRADVEAVLGPGEALVPESRPPDLELTPVGTSAPRSVTRLAAPGAAVAIIGLLGLVGVRVARGRR